MTLLKIKPISINEAYRGRRFSTKDLKKFKEDIWHLIPYPRFYFEKTDKLSVIYIFGVSSKASDGDNCIKAFQDILAEKYGFNDNQIYKWDVKKEIVKKGEEFIWFDIDTIDD